MRIAAVLSVVLIALLCTTRLSAQEITGNIEGLLEDENGDPVAFANAVVSGPSLQGSRGVMSTADGYFGVFKLPVGTYTVSISHVSYKPATVEDVIVRLGRTTTLGMVQLKAALFEAPAIIVTERKKLIDPLTLAIGTNLTSDEFRELPINRDYKTITTLVPLVNESFQGDESNFAGSTGHENKYYVDGAEATDPYLGITGTNLPYNFVKDIEIKTGGYEAEYRSSLGGIVNVVSHSGTNEFHGQVFGFFVNNQLQGSPRLGVAEPETGDFTQYDVGLSLGGPIVRDKLWFYGAYNPSFSEEYVDIPGTGFHPDKNITHVFSGKLDWKAASKTRVALTVTGDPSSRDAVGVTFGSPGANALSFDNPDPYLAKVETGGVNLYAKGTHLFNDNVFLEASLSGVTRKIFMEGLTERGRNEILFIDGPTATWSGGYLSPTDDRSRQITGDAVGTFGLGRHTVKTGIGYRDNKLDANEEYIYMGRVMPGVYARLDFYLTGTMRSQILSAFVQDSWRLTGRLRLNAGIRWDAQYFKDPSGEIAQSITDQFQPRVGLVYQPGELGTQKVFASYGRFYQELGLPLIANYRNENVGFGITYWDHDPRDDPSGGIGGPEYGVSADEVDGLKGQHYDEFSLGYERQLGSFVTVGARGIYRSLGNAVEVGTCGDLGNYGNPGEGLLSCLPEAKREYKALEINLQTFGGIRYFARVSYVLSENNGNYPGLFFPATWNQTNFTPLFHSVESMVNSEGLLPNDRTHVFKISAFYGLRFGMTVGTSLAWMSGTPMSVMEGSSEGVPYLNFAVPRGSAGRTPEIWDLNFRFAYDLAYLFRTTMQPRLILDVFHIGSQLEPVAFDETKNFMQDAEGNQIAPNPTFGMATQYQPPPAVRLGFELNF
jgi:hypothetical protein